MFGRRRKKTNANIGPELTQIIKETETLFQKIEDGVRAVDRSAELSVGRAARDRFVGNINNSLKTQFGSELDLTPHCIFPEEVWTNPIFDEFLFQKMPTTPFEPWNTLLLASDLMTSALLGIPVVPAESSSNDILAAHMHIGDVERFMAGSDLAPPQFHDKATNPLYVSAMRMAAKNFGTAEVIKSRKNFSQDPSIDRVLQPQ